MRIKSAETIIFVIVALASGTIAAAEALIGFPILAVAAGEGRQEEEEKFIAQMSGVEELPPLNDTSAIGIAQFKAGQDNIMYTVNVTDIENVTAAHIHSGQVGENGPVVTTLFKEDSPTTAATTTITTAMNGVLSKGNITSINLEGPMTGKLLSNLTSAMRNEQTYVNVHTQQKPNGEIRGQILNQTSVMIISK